MARSTGFRTPSGAIKLQVLCTPAEYKNLLWRARQLKCSVSMLARTYLAERLGQALDVRAERYDLVPGGHYQRRGFAQ